MKNIFNQLIAAMPATRILRETIAGFIVQSLQPYMDEKKLPVAGLHFYILCADAQAEEAVRTALYTEKAGMFKAEHLERTLANHFIQTEPAWFFEWHIVKDKLPENCMKQDNFGLTVVTAIEHVPEHFAKAALLVLAGEAEQKEYMLDPQQQLKFYIGRGKTPQLSSGKIQQNDIVFLSSANAHVSRNHAFIVYEPKTAQYVLYPDKGGLPENGNKLKVHTSGDKIKWLNIYGVGHSLCSKDQIELGGEAVLRFNFL
jgi:hypothetical protein